MRKPLEHSQEGERPRLGAARGAGSDPQLTFRTSDSHRTELRANCCVVIRAIPIFPDWHRYLVL